MTEKTIGLYPAPVVPDHRELKLLTRMNLRGSVACAELTVTNKLP